MTEPEKFLHSNPALIFFIIYSAGIAIGWHFIQSIPVLILFTLLGCTILSALIFRHQFLFFLYPAIAITGILQIHLALNTFPDNHLLLQNFENYQAVEGWIEEAQYRRNGKNRYLLQCNFIYTDSKKVEVQGTIYLFQGKFEYRLKYGDRIRLSTRIQKPPLPGNPGEFNFRKYLQLKDIHFQAVIKEETCQILSGQDGNPLQKEFFVPIQNFIRSEIEKHIPNPASAVVKALLLGERQDVERSILQQFQRTGIVHVLAISGLHVGFILMLFLLFFGLIGLSYNKRILFSLFFLFLFIALVNFKAPVLRAGIMAALYFAAQAGQKKVSSLNIIGVAGLVILFFSPQQLLMPGFQFSFAAVGGILYAYPKFKTTALFRTRSHLINKWIMQPFMVSLAAVLATVPLTWYYYGTLQTGAVFINVLLIPLIGGFVIIGFIFILIASLGLGISAGIGQLIYFYFMGILKLNAFCAQIPFVQFTLVKPSLISLLLIILFIFFLFNLQKKLWLPAVFLLTFLFILNSTTSNHLRISFVNVGQGDAAIVEFPNGKVMVVDGGDRKFTFDSGDRYLIPLLNYYGIKKIDYLIGTHAHSDHFGGLISIIKKFPVDTLILSRYPGKSKLYQKFLSTAQFKNVPVSYKERGQEILIGQNYRIYVLHPFGSYVQANTFSGNEVNNSSLVLKVCYGDCSFLLTGDLEQNAEKDLLGFKSILNSDVLKAGHHGSKTSTSADFLDLVQPNYSVISVGKRNKFFHPSRLTMQRLKQNAAHPLRTDRFGALVFESDGKEVRLINWR